MLMALSAGEPDWPPQRAGAPTGRAGGSGACGRYLRHGLGPRAVLDGTLLRPAA
jgi:hypothetical protein